MGAKRPYLPDICPTAFLAHWKSRSDLCFGSLIRTYVVQRHDICPDRKGVEKAVFSKSTTWIISAQLLCQHTVKPTVASHESQGRNRRKFKFYINLRRKPSSPNFCQKPENVAFRSMLAPCLVG